MSHKYFCSTSFHEAFMKRFLHAMSSRPAAIGSPAAGFAGQFISPVRQLSDAAPIPQRGQNAVHGGAAAGGVCRVGFKCRLIPAQPSHGGLMAIGVPAQRKASGSDLPPGGVRFRRPICPPQTFSGLILRRCWATTSQEPSKPKTLLPPTTSSIVSRSGCSSPAASA